MQYAGSAWDELKHIRQAIGFLVSGLHLFVSSLSGTTPDCCRKMSPESLKCSVLAIQVIHQKPKKTLDEISHDLCPVSDFNHRANFGDLEQLQYPVLLLSSYTI